MAEDPNKRAQQIVGKGKNVSVRRVQVAGLAKPASAPAKSDGGKARWRKLPLVNDWGSYRRTPMDVILLKDIERAAGNSEALAKKLAQADSEDLAHLQGLCKVVRGPNTPLEESIRKLAEVEAAVAPLKTRAKVLVQRIGDDARSFCLRFIRACDEADMAELGAALQAIGFPPGDYAHIAFIARELDEHSLDGESAPAASLASGFARGLEGPTMQDRPMFGGLGAKGCQAFIVGVVLAGGESTAIVRAERKAAAALLEASLAQGK